jgi:hypothetical protein
MPLVRFAKWVFVVILAPANDRKRLETLFDGGKNESRFMPHPLPGFDIQVTDLDRIT